MSLLNNHKHFKVGEQQFKATKNKPARTVDKYRDPTPEELEQMKRELREEKYNRYQDVQKGVEEDNGVRELDVHPEDFEGEYNDISPIRNARGDSTPYTSIPSGDDKRNMPGLGDI